MFISSTTIGFIVIGIVLYLWHRSERYGWFIKHGLKDYHDEVEQILRPYMTSRFAKTILDDHAQTCKKFSKAKSLGEEGDFVRTLCKRHTDRKFVKTYAMMAIISLRYTISAFDSEKEALDRLVGDLREKLMQKNETLPDLHDHFHLDENFLPMRYYY